MFKTWKLASVCILVLFSLVAHAKQVRVKSLRFWTAPDHTRVVFDVSSSVHYRISRLNNPERVVIDLLNTKLSKKLAQPPANHPLFKKIRSAPRNKKNLRVVLDLKERVFPKTFTLAPVKKNGNRLVVDLFSKNKKNKLARTKKIKYKKLQKNKQKITKQLSNRGRDIVIAIDAGHGGEDSGALGKHGTQEKKVVLQIAKKLAWLVNNTAGMKAVLVRKGDYYIALRQRMEIARSKKADLFVSIHADAFKNSKVKGASVYTLSNHGATSEASRWLAEHENAADLVGGVKLANKEDMLANVLMDMSQKATKDVSYNIAKKVLSEFKGIGHLHSKGVQKAGFMVLKSPDIPSILVETAFISNPSEEKKLRSRSYQLKMAKAILSGVVEHFTNNAPVGTYFANKSNTKHSAIRRDKNSQKHIIARGDTLSGIADLYGVSMESIKSHNALGKRGIKAGQTLIIPTG